MNTTALSPSPHDLEVARRWAARRALLAARKTPTKPKTERAPTATTEPKAPKAPKSVPKAPTVKRIPPKPAPKPTPPVKPFHPRRPGSFGVAPVKSAKARKPEAKTQAPKAEPIFRVSLNHPDSVCVGIEAAAQALTQTPLPCLVWKYQPKARNWGAPGTFNCPRYVGESAAAFGSRLLGTATQYLLSF